MFTILKKYKKSGKIDDFFVHDPHIGLGPAMDEMFKLVETPYIINLQEDWIFERCIDLDRLLWVMDKHNDLNLLIFNTCIELATISPFENTIFLANG